MMEDKLLGLAFAFTVFCAYTIYTIHQLTNEGNSISTRIGFTLVWLLNAALLDLYISIAL